MVEELELLYQKEPSDSTIARELAKAYANLAWNQLFTGDAAGAVISVEHGLAADPAVTWGYTNLALAHLLAGRWPEAEKIYMTWKDRSWKTSGFEDVSRFETFGEAFLADLDELERLGIRHPDFAKARALLGGK